MKKDNIVEEIRNNRKQIEQENGSDWKSLEEYLYRIQADHKDKLYKGHPKKLSTEKVA